MPHAASHFADRFDRLSLLYIANDAANAVAVERNGYHAVGIYVGLLPRLWAAFQLGLSRPEFLTDALDTPPIVLAPEASTRRLSHATLHRLPLAEWSDERRKRSGTCSAAQSCSCCATSLAIMRADT